MAACKAELTVQPHAIKAGEVWVAEDGKALVGVLEIVPKEPDAELRLIFVAPGRIGAESAQSSGHMPRRALARWARVA